MPEKTVGLIIEQGNQYLITVKGNQPKLLNCLKEYAKSNVPLSTYETEEKSHGRIVKREIKVFRIPENIPSGWTNPQAFVQVTRSGIRQSKEFSHTTYYLTSLCKDAEYLAVKIQGRWRIENQLHWVRDVIFKEDDSPIHDHRTMTNFAVFLTFALNVLRFTGFVSVTEGQRWLGGRASRLLNLLE